MIMQRLVQFTIFVTLLLIALGGLVHNTESSLACPDWPLCFGKVFPKMEGGILIEHSHRLLASFVGLLSILGSTSTHALKLAAQTAQTACCPQRMTLQARSRGLNVSAAAAADATRLEDCVSSSVKHRQ